MIRRSTALALVLALASAPGCGAGAASRAAGLRTELAALDGTPASETEPAQRAREAAVEAERAEREGMPAVADEHASRARAWAHTAVDEAEAAALDERLGALEAELLELETQAAGLEHAAAHRRRTDQAEAATRAAREETLRALVRAEADESAPRRARRLGLSDGPEVVRLADVLAERARVLLAAAVAMGAAEPAVRAAREALEGVGSIAEPAARLAAADRAHGRARAALADARHRRGEAPTAEEIAALTEALEAEGFTPFRDDQGLGARVESVFEGTTIRPSARGRLRRLGELLASHPAGPVMLLVDSSSDRAGQALANARLTALRQAVLGARAREVVVAFLAEVRLEGPPPPAGEVARVLLPAYVPRTPTPASAEPASAEPVEESRSDSEE
jgi:hypothetical protein